MLESAYQRNLARYDRMRWLSSRYYRQPWNLLLWYRVVREMWKMYREMESGQ